MLLPRSMVIFLRGMALTCILARVAAGYDVAVIPMGSTHEFWKAVHAGAVQAERELNASGVPVRVIWKGPLREDDRDRQIQVIENFVGRQVNGIVLAPFDSRALVRPVEEAVKARIPVVIIGSALRSSLPVSFVATDNREGGRVGARRLGQLLQGRGHVILLRCQAGSEATEEREAGFLETIGREFPQIELISTNQYGGATRATAQRVAEGLLNRLGAKVDGVFAPNESTATGMLLALRDAGLAGGKVKFVGFDSGETLAQGLRAGDLQGLVLQDPFGMGYHGVKTVVAALRGEAVKPLIRTRLALVTRENMNAAAMRPLLHPEALPSDGLRKGGP